MFYQNTCSDIYFQPINQWIFSYDICNQSSRQTEVLIANSTSLIMGRTIKNVIGGGGGCGRWGNLGPAAILGYQISCMIFLGHSMNFFHLMFPWENFLFLYFARPPHKFSNGPSLRVCAWENQAGDDLKTTISTTSWSHTSLTKVESSV